MIKLYLIKCNKMSRGNLNGICAAISGHGIPVRQRCHSSAAVRKPAVAKLYPSLLTARVDVLIMVSCMAILRYDEKRPGDAGAQTQGRDTEWGCRSGTQNRDADLGHGMEMRIRNTEWGCESETQNRDADLGHGMEMRIWVAEWRRMTETQIQDTDPRLRSKKITVI